MQNTLFTQIIALIGCVTGVCSLILNFYKILSEKPKIKLENYKCFLNGFYNNKNDSYETNKILIINLRINNISIYPVSFKNAILKYNNLVLRANYKYKLSEISFPNGKSSIITYDIDKQYVFPSTIQPMQIINCSIIFPFADELFDVYLQNNSKPMKISINLFTANKHIKFKTKIFELTEENIICNQNENKDKLHSM